MTPDPGTLTLGAAFAAGLAASGHCIGMCGGIAGALALRSGRTAGGPGLALAAAYNLSRIASYSIAGSLVGFAGGALLRSLDIGALVLAFRIAAGAVMLAVAGRLLFGWRLLDPLEGAGARLWRMIAPRTLAQGRVGGLRGAIGLGLAWGWLPCGMSYSMLLLAATTAGAASGAAVMAAFGLGTLPSMLTATLAFDRVSRSLVARPSMRRLAGALLVAFGLWTAGQPLYHTLQRGQDAGSHEHHHSMQMAP